MQMGTRQLARLRWIWEHGRPVHLSKLSSIDLDLFKVGAIRHASSASAAAVVEVTETGIALLHAQRTNLLTAQRHHHSLAERVAADFERRGLMTWQNIELLNPMRGSAGAGWTAVRPDVYACKPTCRAASANPIIVECKVRRADFLSDLGKPEKRGAYLELAQAVYYACPRGLIDQAEVPTPTGLICEEEEGTFVIVKRARRAKGFTPHPDVLMSLLTKRGRAATQQPDESAAGTRGVEDESR